MQKNLSAVMALGTITLAVCLLRSLSCGAAATGAEAIIGAPPHIVFTESAHDFGNQAPNASPRHRFTFKNSGGETLIIEKVKAG